MSEDLRDQLTDEQRAALLKSLGEARQALSVARSVLVAAATNAQIVGAFIEVGRATVYAGRALERIN